jgi:anti-anti-sigma factor
MLGVCKAVGEIDMANAPAFRARLHDAIDDTPGELVVVDCSDLVFMGAAAYHALVDATAYAVRRNRTLVIRNLSAACGYVMRLCDRDRELHIEP